MTHASIDYFCGSHQKVKKLVLQVAISQNYRGQHDKNGINITRKSQTSTAKAHTTLQHYDNARFVMMQLKSSIFHVTKSWGQIVRTAFQQVKQELDLFATNSQYCYHFSFVPTLTVFTSHTDWGFAISTWTYQVVV